MTEQSKGPNGPGKPAANNPNASGKQGNARAGAAGAGRGPQKAGAAQARANPPATPPAKPAAAANPPGKAAAKPAPKPAAKPPVRPAPKPTEQTIPVAKRARTRLRHVMVILSFLVLVVAPATASFWYLYERANDQYASTVAFSVRAENYSSPLDLLGGISSLSSGGSADSDILYEYIQSQQLVQKIEDRIGLSKLYSKAVDDPVFAFDPEGQIEDLVSYWNRMVDISYDSGTQLIEVRAKAFTADDAHLIAQEILDEGTLLVNQLNLSAREDATRFAKDELEKAVTRLKDARAALTEFRTTTQIIDPTANLQGQMGLLNQLEQQLASAMIESDLLLGVAKENDPRVANARRRIEVIEDRIKAERVRLAGKDGQGEGTLSTLVGDYERLVVDQEFAEKSYLAALSAHDGAVAEAQRTSRYLAAHIAPTMAQSPRYPERLLLGLVVSLFLFLAWAVLILIYYSLRDRR